MGLGADETASVGLGTEGTAPVWLGVGAGCGPEQATSDSAVTASTPTLSKECRRLKGKRVVTDIDHSVPVSRWPDEKALLGD